MAEQCFACIKIWRPIMNALNILSSITNISDFQIIIAFARHLIVSNVCIFYDTIYFKLGITCKIYILAIHHDYVAVPMNIILNSLYNAAFSS